MVESLMLAKAEFEDDVILSYSDILFSEAMLQKMLTNADDFAVAVDKNWQFYWQKRYGRIDFDTESLSINGDGCITSLGLENPPLSEIDARYIGLLKFSRAGLDKITDLWVRDYAEYLDKPWQQSGKHIRQAYMTDLLHALIKEVNVVKAVEFNNGWLEFDTNEDYENACQWVEDGSIKELIEL
jgi:choline kinase